MHEEKSRFYWYQFSDYTLVWPTIKQKTTFKVVFCFKYCGYETNFAGSTISNVRIVQIGI